MKARAVKKLDPEAPLAENAARIIRVRLDELRSLAPKALEPDRDRAQHDLRIAAKRLRYPPAEIAAGKRRHIGGSPLPANPFHNGPLFFAIEILQERNRQGLQSVLAQCRERWR